MAEKSDRARQTEAIEEHRAIVRDIDKSFASAYGFGGAAVLLFAAIPLVIGWWRGWMASPGTYVVAITFGLIGLWILRRWVARRRAALRERIVSYCEVNDLDIDALVKHFQEDGGYPYFVALFERDRDLAPSADTVDER